MTAAWVDLLKALLPALAVLAGTAITLWHSRTVRDRDRDHASELEAAKASREESQRIWKLRSEAYAELLSAADATLPLLAQIRGTDGAVRVQAMQHIVDVYYRLILIAPYETGAAATQLQALAREILTTPAVSDARWEAYARAKERLINCARRDLGVMDRDNDAFRLPAAG